MYILLKEIECQTYMHIFIFILYIITKDFTNYTIETFVRQIHYLSIFF